jgi:hypothetical protein
VTLQAQGFLLTRADGSQLPGQVLGLETADTGRAIVFAGPGGKLTVPWTEILGLQGPSPRVTAAVAVYLVGGDELKGLITGGDDEGETLALETAIGRLKIPLDRLRSIVFRTRAKTRGVDEFRLSKDDDFDEAVFLEAGRGLDVQGGEIDRLTDRGVYFARAGEDLARMFRFDALVGLTIREGAGAEEPGSWSLITTAGDRLRVELLAAGSKQLRIRTEFGENDLPYEQISALTHLGGSRRYLSDMKPVRIAEAGDDGGLDQTPLYSFQRDRTVSGGVLLARRSPADGYLVVDGWTYGKGLGVHSKCELTYRVPPKMTKFYARVAVDDEVRALGIKGDADVVVRSGDTVLWSTKGLCCGQKPASLGVLAVTPGALLTLEVDFGKGLFPGDRVDWLSAVFLH